jgi:hypothetical protein
MTIFSSYLIRIVLIVAAIVGQINAVDAAVENDSLAVKNDVYINQTGWNLPDPSMFRKIGGSGRFQPVWLI